MSSPGVTGWDRAMAAVETVGERLRRAVDALAAAGILHAVVGGNAVASWVETVDPAGVRNTPDVDILIHREAFPAVKAALEAAVFVHQLVGETDAFLDTPTMRPRKGVHLLYAGERVKPADVTATPDVAESVVGVLGYRVVTLDALVRMKLTAHRTIDRVHLRDMIDVGLIDAAWPARLPPPLGDRLQAVLDDPDG